MKDKLLILKSSQRMHRRVSKNGKVFYAGTDANEEYEEEKLKHPVNYKVKPLSGFDKGDKVVVDGKKGEIQHKSTSLLGYSEYAVDFEDGTRRWVKEEKLRSEGK